VPRAAVAIALLLIAAGCAPWTYVDEIDATAEAKPVTTIHLDVQSEDRDHDLVRKQLEQQLARVMPHVRLVANGSAADVTVMYLPTGTMTCTHCDMDRQIQRQWHWFGVLTFRGGQRVLLGGEIDKFRGAPERFFAQQLAEYLATRGE
jgi:hypothetical protein